MQGICIGGEVLCEREREIGRSAYGAASAARCYEREGGWGGGNDSA